MASPLEGWPTKAKKTPSPHEVRLACWTPTQYFNVLGKQVSLFQNPNGRTKTTLDTKSISSWKIVSESNYKNTILTFPFTKFLIWKNESFTDIGSRQLKLDIDIDRICQCYQNQFILYVTKLTWHPWRKFQLLSSNPFHQHLSCLKQKLISPVIFTKEKFKKVCTRAF